MAWVAAFLAYFVFSKNAFRPRDLERVTRQEMCRMFSDSPRQPRFFYSFYMSCLKTRSLGSSTPYRSQCSCAKQSLAHTHWNRITRQSRRWKRRTKFCHCGACVKLWGKQRGSSEEIEAQSEKSSPSKQIKAESPPHAVGGLTFPLLPSLSLSLDLVFSFHQFVALIFLPHLSFIALAFVFSTCPLCLPLFVLLTLLSFHSLLSSLSFMRAVLNLTLPTVSGRYTNCNLNK